MALDNPCASGTAKTLISRDIKEHLDSRVVGQEQAKLMLSVLFSMHLHRTPQRASSQRPPNAIIVGPTGCGKTHTLRVASSLLNIPFLSVDTTTLVPSGGRGVQIGHVVTDLVAEAESLVKSKPELKNEDPLALAGRGVVFFDEFDKIAVFTGDAATQSSNDAWNLSVQRALLKFTEGALVGGGVRDVLIPQNVDTSGILVLAGGAFQGIQESRIKSKRPEGVQREIRSKGIISHDFISFGMMPELIARLQVVVEFKGLGVSELRSVLDNPFTSPIEVWSEHFRKLGKGMTLTEAARDFIANRAMLLNLGARGLNQVLFPALAKLTYEMEAFRSGDVVIDVNDIKEALNALGA